MEQKISFLFLQLVNIGSIRLRFRSNIFERRFIVETLRDPFPGIKCSSCRSSFSPFTKWQVDQNVAYTHLLSWISLIVKDIIFEHKRNILMQPHFPVHISGIHMTVEHCASQNAAPGFQSHFVICDFLAFVWLSGRTYWTIVKKSTNW